MGKNSGGKAVSPPRKVVNVLTLVQNSENTIDFNLLNTDAFSLRPKIVSFIDSFKELELSLAIVTETWLRDDKLLEDDIEELLLCHNIKALVKSRAPNNLGVSHGGVGVFVRGSDTKIRELPFPNPECFKVLPAEIKVENVSRTIYVVAVYLPPGYTVARGKACLQHVNDLVLHIKGLADNPYMCFWRL